MANWTDPNGFQVAALHGALLHAYPAPMQLSTMFFFKLNKNLAEYQTAGVGYGDDLANILLRVRAEGWLPELVGAAYAYRPLNPKLQALERTYGLTGVKMPGARVLEDIVRQDAGFQDVLLWIQTLERLAYRVCKIEYPLGDGKKVAGTGWLVARDLLLTNWHVVARVLNGSVAPAQVTCWFDHAVGGPEGAHKTAEGLAANWCVAHSEASPSERGTGPETPTAGQLDFALVRLANAVGEARAPDGQPRGWIEVRRGAAAPDGAILFVLQHPDGQPLKLAAGTARGESAAGARLLHDANTEGGSSGSPCFDVALRPIALHHAGDVLYDGRIGKPEQNQAVPIGRIVDHLAATGTPAFWTG